MLSVYFKESGLGVERWVFVPYRDLLNDVESTVIKLLTRFRYMAPVTQSGADNGDGVGAMGSPSPDLVSSNGVPVPVTVTAQRSNMCETGANDVRVGSSASHDSEYLRRTRTRTISSSLVDLLRIEKQRKGETVNFMGARLTIVIEEHIDCCAIVG